MQENHLFEYAVIRVVPHVEREEFINIGVILFCAKSKFLKAVCEIDEMRVRSLCSKTDINEVKKNVDALRNICEGNHDSGPIGRLPAAERFRWLTASRSTILQTSKVHPGLTSDPEKTLSKLFRQLVVVDDDC